MRSSITITESREESENLAAAFARTLKPGACVGLVGLLGAGKTAFTRGLFLGLGGDENAAIQSPTFTLMHEYPIPAGSLYHFDLYRLSSEREFFDLDFEPYLTGNNIAVVEWADRFEGLKPYFTHWVSLEILEGDQRKIIVTTSPATS